MGLGTFGVINSQKFQPSGLKIESLILTRSRLEEYGIQKFRWIGRKIDRAKKNGLGKWGIRGEGALGPVGGS